MMIKNREDYKFWVECDRVALRENDKILHYFTNEIWRYERLLRKIE